MIAVNYMDFSCIKILKLLVKHKYKRQYCRYYNSKYEPSSGSYIAPKITKRDVIIIGGGHNGLVCSNYLAQSGLDVLVLERRHIIGGAAVTEEIFPGFKFSRASYLAGLLRPDIIKELELENYGFKYITRDPSSFTPTTLSDNVNNGKYLLLGSNDSDNWNSIAQFSFKDADNYVNYEEFLNKIRDIITPILDSHPPNIFDKSSSYYESIHSMKTVYLALRQVIKHRNNLSDIYQFMTAPAQHTLDQWFESDILKTTLATDAVIGYLGCPTHIGSGYVLLHHIMGEAAGIKGVWAYVEGGMGKITESLAKSAVKKGVEIITNATVKEILYDNSNVTGVKMTDNSVIHCNKLISATTPYHTFVELLKNNSNKDNKLINFRNKIKKSDYACASMKVNIIVNELPNFTCFPTTTTSNNIYQPGPMHKGTIHFETSMHELIIAYNEASKGIPANKPVIEMTIPSSLDNTLISTEYKNKGYHIIQLFIQFVPYELDSSIGSWSDESFKQKYVNKCFDIISQYCPNFTKSIVNYEVLSPLDLEYIFGLHKGSIMHGSIGLHQLGYARPIPGYSSYRTPYRDLYMASAGTHPGGGVMGACGKNCARIVLSDLNIKL